MRTIALAAAIIAATIAQGEPSARDAAPGETASAALRSADGREIGTVTLRQTPNGVLLDGDLSGIDEGTHALHIHTVGACSPDFSAAKGHFNPGDNKHGMMSPDGPHAGDFPNIHVPASGKLRFSAFNARLRLDDGLMDDDGAAVIVHAGADDHRTDPAGAAGDRIACGVLER